MSRIMITGGAGFIGCRLAARLIDSNHDVVCVDSLHPQVHPGRARPADLPGEATLVVADVSSPEQWPALAATHRPEVVVHLAAETGTGQSLGEASRHGMVNVVGTTRMLDAFFHSEHRPSHIVLSSSRAVYGEGRWRSALGADFYPSVRSDSDLRNGHWNPRAPDGGSCEPLSSVAGETQTHPSSIYAATKLAQETLLNAWCSSVGVNLSVLRLQNVYGPGQSLSNQYTGVLALFAQQAMAGERIDIYEDGEIWRDFVYVDDVVSAFVASISKPPASSRLLDIGSQLSTTIASVATTMAHLQGAPDPVVSGRFRSGDVRAAKCEIDAARLEIGYQPLVALEDGLQRLLDWVAAQPGRSATG